MASTVLSSSYSTSLGPVSETCDNLGRDKPVHKSLTTGQMVMKAHRREVSTFCLSQGRDGVVGCDNHEACSQVSSEAGSLGRAPWVTGYHLRLVKQRDQRGLALQVPTLLGKHACPVPTLSGLPPSLGFTRIISTVPYGILLPVSPSFIPKTHNLRQHIHYSNVPAYPTSKTSTSHP